MAEDKLTRLLAMQRQLLCGNAVDKAAAAAEYGVSAKSIQRDLETLRGWFGTQGNDLIYDREADAYRLLQPEEARLTKSEVLAVCKFCWRAAPLPRPSSTPSSTSWWPAAPRRKTSRPCRSSSATSGSIMCRRTTGKSLWTSCGRWARPSATTACWRWITPAPAARPSTAACSRWVFCSASIISIWRRSLRASTKKSTLQTPRTARPRSTASTASRGSRSQKTASPSPTATASRKARCASASSSCTAANCSTSSSNIPARTSRPCSTACRPPGWWNSCPKAGRWSRRRCLTATG